MFRDEGQSHRVISILERYGRLRPTRGVMIHDGAQTQMMTFLSWLGAADRGQPLSRPIDYLALKRYGDEEMLTMQMDLVMALCLGSAAIDAWVEKYGPRVYG